MSLLNVRVVIHIYKWGKSEARLVFSKLHSTGKCWPVMKFLTVQRCGKWTLNKESNNKISVDFPWINQLISLCLCLLLPLKNNLLWLWILCVFLVLKWPFFSKTLLKYRSVFVCCFICSSVKIWSWQSWCWTLFFYKMLKSRKLNVH